LYLSIVDYGQVYFGLYKAYFPTAFSKTAVILNGNLSFSIVVSCDNQFLVVFYSD